MEPSEPTEQTPELRNAGRASARRGGFTLLELVIASAITVVVLGAVGKMMMESSRAFSSVMTDSHVTARAQVVMDRIVHELVAGRFITLTPPIPVDSTWVRCEKVTGFAGGAPVYGDPVHIELVDIAGQDTDGIRIWYDRVPHGLVPGVEDTPAIITENIVSGGLKFTRMGATLQIEIQFQTPPEDGEPSPPFVITSGVKMRNEG